MKQPDVVCNTCGTKYGNWWKDGYSGPEHHCATYYEKTCDVCGQVAICTEARDFGYLDAAWEQHKEIV